MWALVRGQVQVLEMFSLKDKTYILSFMVSGSLNFDWRIFVRKGILWNFILTSLTTECLIFKHTYTVSMRI